MITIGNSNSVPIKFKNTMQIITLLNGDIKFWYRKYTRIITELNVTLIIKIIKRYSETSFNKKQSTGDSTLNMSRESLV